MSTIEEQLMQVNMKGSEGNLAFPNMLNEAFYSLSLTIQAADYGPTQPQLEVYRKLNERLDEQLKKWAQVKLEEVPKVAALIQQLQLPAISLEEKPTG
jgi:hypothetical protein